MITYAVLCSGERKIPYAFRRETAEMRARAADRDGCALCRAAAGNKTHVAVPANDFADVEMPEGTRAPDYRAAWEGLRRDLLAAHDGAEGERRVTLSDVFEIMREIGAECGIARA